MRRRRGPTRLPNGRAAGVVAAGAVVAAVLVAVLGLVLVAPGAVPGWAAVERLSGARPVLVDRAAGVQHLRAAVRDTGPVLGVAHNAGDRIEPADAAVRADAGVLEVDVVRVGGELRAGRPHPWPAVTGRLLRGPPLDDVWRRSTRVPGLQLDLKDTSAEMTRDVGAFLAARDGRRWVLVSSRSASQLADLRHRAPAAMLLLSIGTPAELERARAEGGGRASAIDGFTVHEGLLAPPVLRWLRAEGRIVFAWTVNDPARAAHLVRAGVDGITTDNLAVLRVLAGPTGPACLAGRADPARWGRLLSAGRRERCGRR